MTDTKKPEEVSLDLAIIKEWLSNQPHLPQDLGDKLLVRFLHSCYYDIEKTKRCIELFCTIRAACPEILKNRDPTSPEMQRVYQITDLGFVKLKDNSHVFFWRLNENGMDHYNYLNDLKLFFMDSDLWISEQDNLATRDIFVIDVKNITLKIVTKLNMAAAKKVGQYQQEALPARLKQIHMINVPSFIDIVLGIMKPFIRPEILETMHFHKPNSDTIYNYINKEELPSDYGGLADSLHTMMERRVEKIISCRDFFMNNNLWIADESKRPQGVKSTKKTPKKSLEKSFRDLDID